MTGAVALGTNVSIGYFAQEHEQVDHDKTTLENVDDTVLKTDPERRALLGSFGLPAKAADQMPATLSGGERAKLGLAMLAAGRANLLVLDEPTNNLDPASIEAVGTHARAAWPGTIVVVSHDRSFVARPRTHARRRPPRRAVRLLARRVPRRRRPPLSEPTGVVESGQDVPKWLV